MMAFGLAALLCEVVGGIALLLYLEGLARRIPAPKVARYTRVALWALLVGLGLRIMAQVSAGVKAPVTLATGPGGAQTVTGRNEVYFWLRDLGALTLALSLISLFVLLVIHVVRLRAVALQMRKERAGPDGAVA